MCLALLAGACESKLPFNPTDPARGPGGLVGNGPPVSNGQFAGDGTRDPEAAPGVAPPAGMTIPSCGAECQSHCAALALDNPVDAAVCPVLWGVGLDTRSIDTAEACRRLFADLVGRFPTRAEVDATCGGRNWGAVARQLVASDAFVEMNQRRWADRLRYNNQALSVERIFDMDRLVGKLYRGLVPYDQFAAVLSAHPVLTRRHATAGDRAEALFTLLLGRPPHENERADLGRLFTLWDNDYYDHPGLGLRLPDAFVEYRCLTRDGMPDEATKGECTSVLWGYSELILTPDLRARGGKMWSGLLRPEEWERLQAPGRILARQQRAFWENAVGEVVQLYLGYDLGTSVPAVRELLVDYVLRYNGDIRAAHHAVVTSQVYLQSAGGGVAGGHRWTYGPLKQVEVETWIDTIKLTTDFKLSRCDHRIPDPDLLLESKSIAAYALVQGSRWEIDERRGVKGDYRDLARTLGGCPENDVGSRFKTISILTTATQEGFVMKLCNPQLSDDDDGAPVGKLLPAGIDAKRALDGELGEKIFEHQMGLFFSRAPTAEETGEARRAAEACTPKPCTAESFARPACYALLSSGEMVFY